MLHAAGEKVKHPAEDTGVRNESRAPGSMPHAHLHPMQVCSKHIATVPISTCFPGPNLGSLLVKMQLNDPTDSICMQYLSLLQCGVDTMSRPRTLSAEVQQARLKEDDMMGTPQHPAQQ